MDAYDISRDIFDPKKHYTGVRMQQGRVLTDDDWNENGRIGDEDKRRSRIDIIGPYGSPDDGYKIGGVVYNSGDQTFDFTIDPGILYLGGLRLHHGKETYRLQYDWLEQPKTAYTGPKPGDLAGGAITDLVYLETWEQGVSAVEDGELFEPALGMTDTATRVRNMARVRIASGIGQNSCADAWTQLKNSWSGLGTVDADYQLVPDATLKVSFPGTGLPQDLCTPQVAGGYLGAENQAIRVQLRKNNTFTWGFDDAAPLYRVLVTSGVVNGVTITTVKLLTPPKDSYHWPLTGQVVELLSWSTLLPNGEKLAAQEGYIDTVATSYDPNAKTFTLNGNPPAGFGLNWQGKVYDPVVADLTVDNPVYFYLRVWNRGTDTGSLAEISYTPGTKAVPGPAVALGNTGIAIQLFGTGFIPGDYWIIAARPETPDQVMPWALAWATGIGIKPMGVRRLFAPLALLQWSLDAGGKVQGNIISDCRKHFRPLTDQECCCTYTVGDGITSKGDFDSIQEAVEALPDVGGKLCILPGIHHDTVVIKGRRNIEICGCGPNAIIVPAEPDDNTDPSTVAVFSIVSSGNIKLCSLTVLNIEGTAVAIYREDGDTPRVVCGVRVENCMLLAAMYVVYSNMGNNEVGNGNIKICNNQMGQFDVDGEVPALLTLGDDVLIERNRIVVIPAPDKRNPNNPGDPGDPGGCIYDPCCKKRPTYKDPGRVRGTVVFTARYLCGVTFATAGMGPYIAQGGIQIGSTSERVKIIQNVLLGGAGNGITFGHLAVTGDDGKVSIEGKMQVYSEFDNNFSEADATTGFNGSVYEILIAENTIQLMGLSGIGVAAVFSLANIGLLFRVDGLGIYRNTIKHCARQTQTLQDAALQADMSLEIAFGGIVLAASENPIIRENHISDNGVSAAYPVCGIFIQLGEKVEITHNRILNNGVFRKGDQLQPGNRGGIVLRAAVQLLDTMNTTEQDTPLVEGVPAANISGNEVDQPMGLALYLVALGQVSVLGNRFTARGLDTTNKEYRLANTILILDLGMSKDLLAVLIILFGSFKSIGHVVPSKKDLQEVDLALLLLYIFMPGGQVLFANNQVSCLINVFNQEIKLLLGAQFIASLDDIGYVNNQCGMTGLFTNGTQLAVLTFVDTILLGVSIRSNDNRWQEGLTLVFGSLLSLGMFNTCADNQATHPIGVFPATFKDNNIILFP